MPLAPAISKLALYAPVKQIVDGRLAHHVEQWLDDISADITGSSPHQVANRALQCYRTLRDSLAFQDKIPVLGCSHQGSSRPQHH